MYNMICYKWVEGLTIDEYVQVDRLFDSLEDVGRVLPIGFVGCSWGGMMIEERQLLLQCEPIGKKPCYCPIHRGAEVLRGSHAIGCQIIGAFLGYLNGTNRPSHG